MLAPKKQASLQGRPSWAEFPCNLIFIVCESSSCDDTDYRHRHYHHHHCRLWHYPALSDTTWYSKYAASNDGDVNQSYRTKRRAWHWGQLFGRARSREGSKGTDSRELAAISCTSANNRVSILTVDRIQPNNEYIQRTPFCHILSYSVIFCHDIRFLHGFLHCLWSCWPGGASPLLSAWERQANSWSGSRRMRSCCLQGLIGYQSPRSCSSSGKTIFIHNI